MFLANDLMLGQRGAGWIETVVIIAIVAMPILGSAAKFFIRKFSPQDKGDEQASNASGGTAPRRDPARPVARPLPSRPVRPVAPGPGTVEQPAAVRRASIPVPEPLRDILSEVMPELVPPRPKPPEARPREEVAAPRRRRTKPQPRTVSRERRAATPRPSSEPRAERSKSGRSSRRVPKESLETRLGSADERVGHLQSTLVATDDAAGGDNLWRDQWASLKNPTRRAIRFAIVMNEILGPPVALRGPHDPL